MTFSSSRIRALLILASSSALACALGFFILTRWVYVSSDDQCFWKRQGSKIVIAEVLPDGVAEKAGLLDGDELVAIQGKRVNPRRVELSQYQINAQPAGAVINYTVHRNDRTLILPVRLVKPFDWAALSLLMAGLVTWGIGLVVVVSSPQRKATRHLFYLGLMSLLIPLAGITRVGNMPSWLMLPFLVIGSMATTMAAPLWFHFFLRFPYPFALRTHRRFLAWMYWSVAILGASATIARVMTVWGQYYSALGELLLNRAARILDLGADAVGCLAVVGGLALFWIGTFRVPASRRKAILPALIITTLILLELVIFIVLDRAAAGKSLVFNRQSWVFFAPLPLVPLSFAYAVLRHGLFDVRRALLRWMTYFAVMGVILTGYLGAVMLVITRGFRNLPLAWIAVIVGLASLPMGWLLRIVMGWLRRKFHRDLQSARALILGELRETRARLSPEGILASLEGSLQKAFRPHVLIALPVEEARVILPPVQLVNVEEDLTDAAAVVRVLQIPPHILRQAQTNQELVLGLGSDEADWVREQGLIFRAHIDALEVQVMVLILANGILRNVLLLGGKYAELNYGREDRDLLREVAVAAGIVLETAILHQRMLDQGRLEQELRTARHIQEGLITSEAPTIPGFQIALRLDPALEIGGDLLWVKHREHGRWLAAVGDVSGKGLPAALYMSQAIALLKFATQDGSVDFHNLLPALDQTMRNLMGPKDFLTLSLLSWDKTGAFQVARAGHPPALLVRGPSVNDVFQLETRGRGLGLRPAGPGDWEIREGVLGPREWLVLYSDGLTEAMDQHRTLYGLERFTDQILAHWPTGRVDMACEAIFQDVGSFETQNRDDRTLFILARGDA